MPRVSQEYRDERRRHILMAARRCFIREGFHQTSMADLQAEAGLSAGTLYGYFTSKNEIIVAIAEEVIDQLAQLLEPVVTQEPTPRLEDAVLQGLRAADELAFGVDGFAPLAPQVWAEALRDDALAAAIDERYAVIHGLSARLVLAEQRLGRIAPDSEPDEVAKVLLGAMMGYILQRLLVGNVDAVTYATGFAGLVRQL